MADPDPFASRPAPDVPGNQGEHVCAGSWISRAHRREPVLVGGPEAEGFTGVTIGAWQKEAIHVLKRRFLFLAV